MDSVRAYKFRIYPDARRQSEINLQLVLGQRGSHAQGENARPKQEATLEELRTDKMHPLRDAVIA